MAESETAQPGGKQTTPGGARPLVAIVALCAIIWLAVFWVERHLGVDILAVGAGAGLSALPILNYLLRARRVEETGEALRDRAIIRALRPLIDYALDPSVLVVLAIVVLVAGSLISSVAVVAEEPRTGVGVLAAPATEDRAPEPRTVERGKVRRFFRLTTPFGRPYAVVADGLRPRTITLYPWLGARIDLADSDPLPTLLVRVPGTLPTVGPRHIVELRTESGEHLSCTRLEPGRGAAYFGPASSIPDELLAAWRAELMIGGLPPPDVERTLLTWLDPIPVRLDSPLRTGARLEVRLISPSREIVASRAFAVSGRPVQDVRLLDAPAPFEPVSESPCFEDEQ